MQVTTASLGFFGLDCSDKSRVTEAIFSLPSSSSISGCQLTLPSLHFILKQKLSTWWHFKSLPDLLRDSMNTSPDQQQTTVLWARDIFGCDGCLPGQRQSSIVWLSNFFMDFSDKKQSTFRFCKKKKKEKQRYVTKKGHGDEGTPEWHITIQICESE